MKRTLIAIAALAVSAVALGGGCSRSIDSKDPIRSLPAPPPVPYGLTAALGDRSVTLSWSVTDAGAVSLYRIYSATDTGSVFALVDSASAQTRVVTNIPFNRTVSLRVTSVNAARIESQPSGQVDVIAGLLQVLLNNGDEYSNSLDVLIETFAPVTPAYIQVSEDPLLAGAPVQGYRSPLPFELSLGDGPKTIYARLTFGDGTEASGVLSDDIILDTEARIDSIYYTPTSAVFAAGDTIYFYLSAHGETDGGAQVTFPGISRVRLRDLGTEGDAVAGDGVYSYAWIVPVGLTVTDGIVTGSFIDAAGNNSAGAQAARLLNIRTTTPPIPVVLAVALTEPETAHLSWTMNNDVDFASYRIYRSVSPGIDVTFEFLTIAIVTDRNNTTYDDFLSTAGTYYYRVFVFDSEGLTAGSNEVMVSR
ncbi:MAG: hypothetical protein AB1772_11800 [Candidatus Zixiibacteriota bacterium]